MGSETERLSEKTHGLGIGEWVEWLNMARPSKLGGPVPVNLQLVDLKGVEMVERVAKKWERERGSQSGCNWGWYQNRAICNFLGAWYGMRMKKTYLDVLCLRQIQSHVAGLAMACLSYLQGISEVSRGKGSQNLDFQNHPKSNGISWYIMVYHGLSWCIMVYHGVSWCIMVYQCFFPIILPVYHDLSWLIMVYHYSPVWICHSPTGQIPAFEKKIAEAPRNAALNSCADARRCLICLPGFTSRDSGIQLHSHYIPTASLPW